MTDEMLRMLIPRHREALIAIGAQILLAETYGTTRPRPGLMRIYRLLT